MSQHIFKQINGVWNFYEKPADPILLPYRYAELRTTKKWYVVFSFRNELTKEMIRYRHRINMTIPEKERKRLAKEYVKFLNNKINSGWNPIVERIPLFSDFLWFEKNKRKSTE
jgi:hypothetical protein